MTILIRRQAINNVPVKIIDEMLIKVPKRAFYDHTVYQLTNFVILKLCSLLIGGSNLFDLSSYTTIQSST